MRVFCKYSGITLWKTDLSLGYDLEDVHPIFKQKKELILKPATLHKFQAAQSWDEKKLYFLAMLNTTDLVTFHCPANPAPYTMEHSFINVSIIASWIDHIRYGLRERIQFPQYIVRPENADLKNISIWLSHLYDIRKIFLDEANDEVKKKDLNERARQIEIEFRKAGLMGQAFTRPLAAWALEMTDVDQEHFEEWKTVLQTPLETAWCLNWRTVKDIQEHLQANLPVTNDQAIAVLHQVRKLRLACQEGYTAGEDTGDDDDESTDGHGAPISKKFQKQNKSPSFEIMEDEDDEPLELPPKPERIKYPSLAKYLGAVALWELLCDELKGKKRGKYSQF